MKQYCYRRLDRPVDGSLRIRLVRLARGEFHDEIRVSLLEHLLPPNGNSSSPKADEEPFWFALSYTWGNLNDRDVVVVRSEDEGDKIEPSCISVTKNLSEALRFIRSAEKDQFLWIDAICIDQGEEDQSLDERAWQVKMMHLIYQQATGVIIWLGPDADDSSYTLEALHVLGSSFELNEITYEMVFKEKGPIKKWSDHADSARERKGLTALLGREWFDRVWIRQEAFFANNETSVVRVGNKSIPFMAFRNALHWVGFHRLDGEFANLRLMLAMSIAQREFSNIPTLLRMMRRSQCRDAKDKIYGILGIQEASSASGRTMRVPVSYSASNTTESVYMDFFKRYTNHFATLRLLEEGGLWQGSESISKRQLPSWVPDWRCEGPAQLDLSMETATGPFLLAECSFLDNGGLKVLGRQAAKVTTVYKLNTPPDLSAYREITKLMKTRLWKVDAETAIERMTYALCSLLWGIRVSIEELEEGRKEIQKYIRYINFAESTDDIKPPQAIISPETAYWLWSAIAQLRLKNSALIFSEGSYVGIAPGITQTDDLIYTILGSRALLLLRSTSNISQYQLVGPCYIHHLNWGEALLGPLHPRYSVVQRFEPTKAGYVPKYLDTEQNGSHAETMWDPRINWEELEARPPLVSFVPMNAPPGEPFRMRPESDYLRDRGIQLEELDIV